VIEACLKIAARHGYWAVRNPVGRYKTLDMDERIVTFGTKGDPDYTFTHARYRSFLAEFKATGGELSPAQIKRIASINITYPGLPVVVIDDPEEFSDWLAQHERSP